MFASLLLSTLASFTPTPAQSSLLAAVPEGAYVLAHCRDFAAIRARAERNDWYRLLASSHGEPLLDDMARELRYTTHSEVDELLPMAKALAGEIVFFDTGAVAGLVTEPPADRAALADLMRDWLPPSEQNARRTLEIAGGTVELVAWPYEVDGWSGRSGHYAAFLDHPGALAIYSGDSSELVMAALTASVSGLGADPRAPLVSSYLEAGGGKGGGIELFVDFTPLISHAEAALKDAAGSLFPDPTNLLGLEKGTWLHASSDIFPGTRIDCHATLHLPPDTVSSQLADAFKPLPHALPADLPQGVWGLWALNFDLNLFYRRARAAYEEADRAEELEAVDAGLGMVRGAAGVDPIDDVLNQLDGLFAVYLVDPPKEREGSGLGELEGLLSLGFHAGLVDGDAFLSAFEKLTEVGGLGNFFELEDIAGVDAYVFEDDDDIDGGLAFLPHAFTVAPTRRVLERALRALTRAEGASLLDGSRMQAAIDENAGACFLTCIEMTPFRALMLPELKGELRLPPLEEGGAARDPFDSQLISSARRTPQGFELRLHTR